MSLSTTTTVEIAPAGTWAYDPAHSTIGFEIAYMGGTFRGSFADVTAKLDTTGEPAISGSAKVESIKVQDENLTAHLLTPEFFDAERHPELGFESTSLERVGNDLRLEGELTINGITKPVTLEGTIGDPLTDPYGRERIGVQLATTVDRTQFGLKWNVPLPSGDPALSNDVRIVSELFLVKEA
jgi:polyisoprenoid-binding protein YceI